MHPVKTCILKREEKLPKKKFFQRDSARLLYTIYFTVLSSDITMSLLYSVYLVLIYLVRFTTKIYR